MKNKITRGFILFKPWSNEVVNGNLYLLVRKFSTKIRERVGVIASKSFDFNWSMNVDYEKIINFKNKTGLIGSVIIKDCIEIDNNNIKNKMIEIGGEEYWKYYPKHLIPNKKKMFIWILEEPMELIKPKNVEYKGLTWVKLD